MKPKQGYLLEFVPGAGFPDRPQPVAVFMSADTDARRIATDTAREHWQYTFARMDWATTGNWGMHDGHPVLFPSKGPRDHHYRLVPIKVFLG